MIKKRKDDALYCIVWSAISVSAPTLRLWVTWYSSISFTPKRSASESFFPRKDTSLLSNLQRKKRKKSLKSCSTRRSSPQFKPPNNAQEHSRRIKDSMTERTQSCFHLNFY